MQSSIESQKIKEILSDLLKSIQVQSQKLKENINLIIQNILASIDFEEVKTDATEEQLFNQFKGFLQDQNKSLLELWKYQNQTLKQKELLTKLEQFINSLITEFLDEQQKMELINDLQQIESQQFLKISAGMQQIIQSLYFQLSAETKEPKEPVPSSEIEIEQSLTEEDMDQIQKFLFAKIKERYTQQTQIEQDDDIVFVTAEEMEKYESVTISQQKKDYEQIIEASQNEQQEIEIIDRDSDYESVQSDEDQLIEVNENAVENQLCSIQAHSKYALCVRSIGDCLITGGGDDSIAICQINKTPEKIELSAKQKIQDYHSDSIDKISINYSNKLICSLGLDNKLQLFSIEKNFAYIGQIAKEFEVVSFEWHHKADVILIGAKDGILGLFSGKTGELLQGASLMVTGDQEDIETIAISKGSGKMACTLGTEAKSIKCWSLKESRLIAGLEISKEMKFHQQDANITKVEWMGEEEALVTAGTDGNICMVISSENLKHLKVAQQIKVSKGEIECMVNTYRDELIVGDNQGNVFGLWMAKGIVRFSFQISQGPVLELRFKEKIICGRTAKGEIFAEEYNVFLKGEVKGKFESKYQVHGVDVTEVAGDKYLIAVCDDGKIKIWKI